MTTPWISSTDDHTPEHLLNQERSASPRAESTPNSGERISQSTPLPHPVYHSLQQLLGVLDLDVLRELESFRAWQQQQRTDAIASPLLGKNFPHGARASNEGFADEGNRQSYAPYLQPQDVLEDLELDETQNHPGVFSPLSILLMWLLSCFGIGLGLWWLISPGDPNRPVRLTESPPTPVATPTPVVAATPSPTPTPLTIDLAKLPLIPVPVSERIRESATADNAPDPDQDDRLTALINSQPEPLTEEVEPLPQSINWLDSLQNETSELVVSPPQSTAASSDERTPPESASALAASPVPDSPNAAAAATNPAPASALSPESPALSPTTPDPLGPNQGEGVFVVLIPYQGDSSLAQARQISGGAFVKDINGQKYVQLASFEQLEYARYEAEKLRKQGLPIEIRDL
ncbi:MAG: hypothetical protein NW237_08050 [Cyanobacteriota bacterium]|nr:hypothetical protein [Cyanobacteriota bacterium]